MVTSRSTTERDRAATERRILDAVGRVLSENGFNELGVNAIARRAGVDKVLIYRYFGGLPELLAAFARRSEFWPTEAELLANARPEGRGDRASRGAAVLKGLLRGLRARPMTQEVLRWELAAPNDLTERLADVREEQGLRVLASVIGPGQHRSAHRDTAAVAALLSAGLTYLVLRSKSAPRWLGVALDERGFARIERAIEQIVRRVLSDTETASGGSSS
jgi:AcrR family transcriptional regulator